MVKTYFRLLFIALLTSSLTLALESCNGNQSGEKSTTLLEKIESVMEGDVPDEYAALNTLLLIPAQPAPGESFKILATGGRNVRQAKIVVTGAQGDIESKNLKMGSELPCWRLDGFTGCSEGEYEATLMIDGKEATRLTFHIAPRKPLPSNGTIWKTTRGWDSKMETIYSAWINAMFQNSTEQTSWKALHEVTQDSERNFLYNYLSLDEDDSKSKVFVKMEPDCADNPYFMRAYFAWKLGLPFGYHLCDRGYLGKNPQTGQWITNASQSSKTNTVQSFNNFIRRIADGVHSGSARTALANENADYYPVTLSREGLRPGTVYADPYGHTLTIVSWVPQTKNQPGVLLAVDAQPDKTIAIKRFWKGNFLFSTSEVVGEPGFKAFRPITFNNNKLELMTSDELTASPGFAPYSLQQKKMEQNVFYLAMERIINPKPLDPEDALMDLIKALHEQLLGRVKSVSTGEAYMQSHPGAVIPMPSNSNAVFQTGGVWEDFSTPNRDLRLLIAMDAVLGFPERVATSPQDFKVSSSDTPEEIKKMLQKILDKKTFELTISYTRSNGTMQELTVAEILNRREAFEVAYNPNDGAEIRWGAPLGSDERSSCKRQAPVNQQKTMQVVRKWFSKRLHPPT